GTCAQTASSALRPATARPAWLSACTHSSNRCRGRAARRIFQSIPATLPPPPRSSLLSPSAPACRWWHRRPCPSGSPADHALRTNRGNCRPTAPVRQSAACALFVGSVSSASAADSTARLPTSNAAKFRDRSPPRLPRPNARPLTSARTAPAPNRNIFSAANAALAAAPSTASPIRGPARVAMLQPFAARLAIAPPHPFGLAVAQLQHRGGIAQLQILVRHPPHHLHSLQLPPTHRCPLQQTSSGWRFSLRGHFYRVREGTLSKSFNILKTRDRFHLSHSRRSQCYYPLHAATEIVRVLEARESAAPREEACATRRA